MRPKEAAKSYIQDSPKKRKKKELHYIRKLRNRPETAPETDTKARRPIRARESREAKEVQSNPRGTAVSTSEFRRY